MNSREFVAAIKAVACEAASKAVIGTIGKPPGRKPDPRLVSLSEWYNSLSSDTKSRVSEVADLTAAHAVYVVLAVFDGIVSITPMGERVDLELVTINGDDRQILNDPAKTALTSLFKEVT